MRQNESIAKEKKNADEIPASRPSEVNSKDFENLVNDLNEPIPESTPRSFQNSPSDSSITPRNTQSPRPLLIPNDDLDALYINAKNRKVRFQELASKPQNSNQYVCFAPLLSLGIFMIAMGAFFLNKDILEHMFGDDTGNYGNTVGSVGSSFIGATPGIIFTACVLLFYVRKMCAKQEQTQAKVNAFEKNEKFDDSSSDTDYPTRKPTEESMATEESEIIYDVEDTYRSYQHSK